MCRLAALTLLSVLYLSHGQVFCPAHAAASCAAAAEDIGDGESLELMQVTSTARRVGGILGAKQLPVAPYLASINNSAELSVQERFTGVWLCRASYATGAKVIKFHGDNVSVHDSCVDWKAHLENESVRITAPDYAAGVKCDVESGYLICSNGDNCSKLDYAVESLLAQNKEQFVGRWVPQDEDNSDSDSSDTGFTVKLSEGGEFFYEGGGDNTSGFLHLQGDGFWQADTCQNNILVGAALRIKPSKSGRKMMASFFVPGFSDWSPSIVHQHPGADKHGFPFMMVSIPIILIIFGVPASFFFCGMEGKSEVHQALAKEAKSVFIAGEELKYDEADSDAEVADAAGKSSA